MKPLAAILLGAALVMTSCSRPSAIGSGGSACARACARLVDLGCAPDAGAVCLGTCDMALDAGILPPASLDCVISAPNPAAARACPGGFCR